MIIKNDACSSTADAILSHCILLLRYRELILAYAAQRAYPIISESFKCGSGFNSVIRISQFGIINITANVTNIFTHSNHLFLSQLNF